MQHVKTFTRHPLSTLLVCIVLFSNATAQDTPPARVGIKGGLNISNFYVDNVDDQNPRFGFHAGIFGKMPVSDEFAIRPELLYTTKGATTTYSGAFDTDGEVSLNLSYIDLPVLAVIDLSDNVSLHGGVYAGYLLNANASTKGDLGDYSTELERDNFQTFDYGFAGGVQFNLDNFIGGLRYNYGMRGIGEEGWAETAFGDAKNSVFQLYTGLRF